MPEKLSWSDKLAVTKGLPKKIEKAGKTMAIPSPKDVDMYMKKAVKGKLITVREIANALARKYETDTCCSLATGIFAWISAYASKEQEEAGKKKITPYWRTIKSDGSLNPKYPGGESVQARKLRLEGHTISKMGKRQFVRDYEKKLQKL